MSAVFIGVRLSFSEEDEHRDGRDAECWLSDGLDQASLLRSIGVAENRREAVDPGVDLGEDVVTARILVHEVGGDESADHTDQEPQERLHVVFLALGREARSLHRMRKRQRASG
ncbi:MAG: hypothetical protein V4703_08445 [Actinomycetota bacterium]